MKRFLFVLVLSAICISTCQAVELTTGTITASGKSVNVDVTNFSALAIQTSGTWSGTLQFEASIDNSIWFAIKAAKVFTQDIESSTTSNNKWVAQVSGFNQVRIRASSFSSGTATIALQPGQGVSGSSFGQGDPNNDANAWPVRVTSLPPISVSGSSVNQGTPNTDANAWPVRITHNASVNGTTAVGASVTGVKPVLIGGKDTDGFLRNVVLDTDGSLLGKVWDGTDTANVDSPTGDSFGTGFSLRTLNHNYYFNGSTWDRMRGDLTNGAFVNVKTSVLPTNAASETGGNLATIAAGKITVTAFLGAGTATIGKVDQGVAGATAWPVTVSNTSATNFISSRLTDGVAFLTNLGQTISTALFGKITDGTDTADVTAASALKVDGSAVTQPISIPTSTAGLGTLMNPLVVSSQARTQTAKTARLLQASSGAAVDTVVLTPTSGKKAIITSCEISTDKTSRIQVHFGTTVSDTNTISGGFYAADGGSFGAFDGNPIPGATNQTVTVDYTQTSGNLLIILTYYEE